MQHDKVNRQDVESLVDGFPGQTIDFFGALRARVYDDRVRQFVIGHRDREHRKGPRQQVRVRAAARAGTLDSLLGGPGHGCSLPSAARGASSLASSWRALDPSLLGAARQCRLQPLPCSPGLLQVADSRLCCRSKGPKVSFEPPAITLKMLQTYGRALVDEQDNVRRVQLAEAYMSGAELAGTDGSSMPPEVVKEVLKKAEDNPELAKELEAKLQNGARPCPCEHALDADSSRWQPADRPARSAGHVQHSVMSAIAWAPWPVQGESRRPPCVHLELTAPLSAGAGKEQASLLS